MPAMLPMIVILPCNLTSTQPSSLLPRQPPPATAALHAISAAGVAGRVLGTAGNGWDKVLLFSTEDCATPFLTMQRNTSRVSVETLSLALVPAACAAGNLGPGASLQVQIPTL